MSLFTVFAIFVLFLILVFTQFYTWSGLKVRRLMSKIPGYSELESWNLILSFSGMPIEGIVDFVELIYGKCTTISSLWFLGMPSVYMGSPNNVETVLKSIQHIRKGREYLIFEKWLEQGLLTSTGAKWHANRKMLTPAFHFRILDTCVPVFNDNALLLVKLLRHNCSGKQKIINTDRFISLCSLDIISEAAMGVRLEAQLQKQSTLTYVNAVRRMGEVGIQRIKAFYLRNPWVYALTPLAREEKRLLKILHGFTESVIRESKKKRQHAGAAGIKDLKPAAFVDFLLEMAETNPSSFTDTEIRQQVDTFMFEGHETTTAALSWTLLLLGLDSDVQERAQKELEEVWGEESRLPKEALGSLPYLEAIIKESLRLYPPVAYLSRELDADMELEEYRVPAGANVLVIPYLLHRQSEVFPDPERFDPDRFLSSGTRHPFAYIPFSGGPRNCIGQRFAMMEMKVVLAHILRNFQIESVTQRDCLKIFSPIFRPKNGIELKLIPRI